MDPLDAQVRQIVFFDTLDLDLDNAGVVVRARRVQGKGDDSVVKLRPVVPDDLPVEPSEVAGLRRRGRRDARRVRLQRLVQGDVGSVGGQERPVRRAPHPQAVHARAAGLLCRPRARRVRARRPPAARADHRDEAEVPAEGVPAPDGRGALVLPGRLAHPRAVDEGAAETRGSRSPPRRGRTWPARASTSPASSRRRRGPPSSTSRRSRGTRTSSRGAAPGSRPSVADADTLSGWRFHRTREAAEEAESHEQPQPGHRQQEDHRARLAVLVPRRDEDDREEEDRAEDR